ncbi:MAG: sugar fermentation stimulation protein A [Halioglobus sp.]
MKKQWTGYHKCSARMKFQDLQEGVLLKRYKRFLADIELPDGETITVHCPNTGAMTGCAVAGSRVWLSRSNSKTRKYPHTWELVETEAGMACIRSVLANQVVGEALITGQIPGFDSYTTVRSEVKYGEGSRADFLLEGEDGRVFIEVKSVTLCRDAGVGAFPDAVSERGRKHLRELQAVLDPDTRSVMLFCVFHSGIESVCAAGDIDSAYREALLEAIGAGVEVLAWKASVSVAGVKLSHVLPFSVDP